MLPASKNVHAERLGNAGVLRREVPRLGAAALEHLGEPGELASGAGDDQQHLRCPALRPGSRPPHDVGELAGAIGDVASRSCTAAP